MDAQNNATPIAARHRRKLKACDRKTSMSLITLGFRRPERGKYPAAKLIELSNISTVGIKRSQPAVGGIFTSLSPQMRIEGKADVRVPNVALIPYIVL